MSESEEFRTPPEPGRFRRLHLSQLPLKRETAVFILVNLLDFFMTYGLLMTSEFQERNPVAAYFLDHWGPIRGLLYYKLAMVTGICVIVQVIAVKRLETARWLLKLGTAVCAVVVIYSFFLYLQHR